MREEIKAADSSTEVTKIIMQVNGLRATSTKSERDHHQADFKNRLRDRYHCANGLNPDVTRCTILNSFFQSNEVIAAHLIGLTNRQCLGYLNLNPNSGMWDDRNGLLIHVEFERRYEAQEITFLYNPDTHRISIQVLYDDVMSKRIGNLTTKLLGVKKNKAEPLLFSHINGRPLELPCLVFPYRRILYYVSKQYYDNAMSSGRSHICATNSCPSEERWNAIMDVAMENSVGFDTSSVASSR